MTQTDNYSLNKFESSDRFDLLALNDNMDMLDETIYNTSSRVGVLFQELSLRLGGMSLAKMTRAEYDGALIHFASTLYAVTDEDGKVTLYLGDTELRSGATVTENTSALTEALPLAGAYTATMIEEL